MTAQASERRFLHSTIAPASKIAAVELSRKLDVDVHFDFSDLFASDLSGRARAFGQMVTAGKSLEDAARLTGLLSNDD